MSESDEVEAEAFQPKAFGIVGDSNVRNHINTTNCRAHPNMKSAQVLSCGSLEIFIDTLRQVKSVADICIVSCLTNFLASAIEGPSTVSHHVEPVLTAPLA